MGSVTRLAEQELGTARHDLLAEGDEDRNQVLQVHDLRPAIVERHHVGAERGLERREAVELVQHDISHCVALQLDHDAVTFAVGFIAQIGNTLDLLFAHQFGDALDHGGLVDLVGNLGDDDRLAVLADGFDRNLAAHHDRAAAKMIGRADALPPQDDAAGRKIRARDDVDKFVDRQRWIIDQRGARIDHLAEIVRRDVCGHADRNAASAIDQKVRKFGRKNRGLLVGAVEVCLKIDGVLVDVVE